MSKFSPDEIYESLCICTDILTDASIPYFLSGGTLLGSVRDGDLIEGDTDWDVNCFSDDIGRILSLKDKFALHGFSLEYPSTSQGRQYPSLEKSNTEVNRGLIKVRDSKDRAIGDIFIYTLFRDGLMRRYDIETKVYWNAKMTMPAWYYEEQTTVLLRNKKFTTFRHPEMILEKIYGELWKVPISRHTETKGYNFAGAHMDANIEKLIDYALFNGWEPYYKDEPKWNCDIKYTNSRVSARWINNHEHPEMNYKSLPDLDSLNISNLNLQYKTMLSKIKKAHSNEREELRNIIINKNNRIRELKKMGGLAYFRKYVIKKKIKSIVGASKK